MRSNRPRTRFNGREAKLAIFSGERILIAIKASVQCTLRQAAASCAGIAVRRTACFRTPVARASMMNRHAHKPYGRKFPISLMDCRDKPGNDGGEVSSPHERSEMRDSPRNESRISLTLIRATIPPLSWPGTAVRRTACFRTPVARASMGVMAGLGPRIHDETPHTQTLRLKIADTRRGLPGQARQ